MTLNQNVETKIPSIQKTKTFWKQIIRSGPGKENISADSSQG